jgi:hypothetical protein
MGPTEMVLEGVDGVHLAQNRNRWRALLSMVMKLLFPKKKEKGREFPDCLSAYQLFKKNFASQNELIWKVRLLQIFTRASFSSSLHFNTLVLPEFLC